MKSWIFIATMLLLSVPTMAVSATYYIDFNSGADANAGTSKAAPWKHAPGMQGFAGQYTHVPGDQFIFKGGTQLGSTGSPAWTATWNISNSGAAGTPDYYGVDNTWYTGASWTPPTIDGGSLSSGVLNPFIYVTGSYITFDGWRLQNITPPSSGHDSYAIEFRSGHDLTVKNMTLPVETRIALYILNTAGKSLSNFSVYNNDISACSWGIAFGISGANSVTVAPIIHDNLIHDMHDQIANSAHGDGIIIFGGGSDATAYIQSPVVYNNNFYGDFSKSDGSAAGMTAMIFLENNIAGTTLVYNNHGTYSATSGGYFIEMGLQSGLPTITAGFYNNTFFAPDGNWFGFAYVGGLSGSDRFTVENNIFSGGSNGYYLADPGTFSALTSDYNDFYNQSSGCWIGEAGGAGCRTYAQFVAQGFETHGLSSNPSFVSTTNLRLSSSSPAIGAGLNLHSIFTTDADGNARPATGAWDIGAYQFEGVKPDPPTNLQATPY